MSATPLYPSPVDRLLTYGDARETDGAWPDYRALGLGPEHVPDLIRMALDQTLLYDEDEATQTWAAPIHAWRALGQLRAEAAVAPLLELRAREKESDWLIEELPDVFALIGSAAIPALSAFLADPSHGLWPRITISSSLEHIGQAHPEARAACIAALSQQLESGISESVDAELAELNGFLVSDLINLKAVEAAPIIERAYAMDSVEVPICGDWEDVQLALGLLTERITPRPRYNGLPGISDGLLDRLSRPSSPVGSEPHTAARPSNQARKTKKKTADASRRRNKKRK